MDAGPTILTQRLALRPFVAEDAGVVTDLAGVREVADTTLTMPHPYPAGAAEDWIATHRSDWHDRRSLTLAITGEDAVMGAVSLKLAMGHLSGELGYWVGVPFWNRGYCTEAVTALIGYSFDAVGLFRIEGRHFVRNPASGRVMQKVGMQFEGVARQAFVRWGQREDVAMYGILATDR